MRPIHACDLTNGLRRRIIKPGWTRSTASRAGKHRLKPILFITLVLAGACIFAEGQRWRNGELTEDNLRAAAEVSVLQQVQNVAPRAVLNTRIDEFQRKTFGAEVRFSGRMTVFRGDFSRLGVWFNARGPVQIRFSGVADVAESSAFVAGVELKRLRYLNVATAIVLDDPKRHADKYEIAWEEEGYEPEWLYDLAIPFSGDASNFDVPRDLIDRALALRCLRREKRFYEAVEMLGKKRPRETGQWADRYEDQKAKLLAELKASPEFRPRLRQLGYL